MSDESIKKAVILAAGTGNRLFPITEIIPKPLTPVNGKSIIERLVINLLETGVNQIVVVTGHFGKKIQSQLNHEFPDVDITFIENTRYQTTNNIYSLWLAREYFTEDFLLLEADVVLRSSVLEQLVGGKKNTSACMVAPKAIFMDGACVELRGVPLVVTAPKQVPVHKQGPHHYKTLNFYRLSSSFASGWLLPQLQHKVNSDELSDYYETLFAQAISEGIEDFQASIVPSYDWYEVDNLNDLDIAEYLLKPVEDQQTWLEKRHGGYWRYPVQDHCLLYNFHYPPKKLLDHLSARLVNLVREYPSAQRPIVEHLSSYYGVPATNLVVGNGVSELIPLLLSGINKPLVIPSPSFNEYEAVIPAHLVRRFMLSEEDGFALSPQKILEYARETGAGHIVLISPNNPTGNALTREDIALIARGAQELGIEVILDESFVDFQGQGRTPSFLPDLLQHTNLSLLFSLSKSHGIGGIRLGLFASANQERVADVRQRLPIWNINSFAEEYLRMFSAHRKEYEASCQKVFDETQALQKALSDIPGLQVFPTEANFIFCRLDNELGTARELITELLQTDAIFLKDCSGKILQDSQQYFRVSSRNGKDNRKLTEAISRAVLRKASKFISAVAS
ncbi:aminotransferase class I/II-fold pyridoxal phosphate-dependent enzyme [Pseudomonas graminis]